MSNVMGGNGGIRNRWHMPAGISAKLGFGSELASGSDYGGGWKACESWET